MTTAEISNALRCLYETQDGQVLASNNLTKRKSAYQRLLLLDKHPQPSEVSETYTVSNQDSGRFGDRLFGNKLAA